MNDRIPFGLSWRYALLLLTLVLAAHVGDVTRSGGLIVDADEMWERIDFPSDASLRAVDVDAHGQVWIAGSRGTIARFAAGEWRLFDTSSDLEFNDIHASGEHPWFVGEAGKILRYTNGGLEEIKNGYSRVEMHGVVEGSDAVWIVGQGGLLLRWQQGLLRPEYSPIRNRVLSISLSRKQDRLIATSNRGEVLSRESGGGWSIESSESRVPLWAALAGSSDSWAGGGTCTPEVECDALLLRKNDEGWQEHVLPRGMGPIYAIEAGRADDVWVLGSGQGTTVLQISGQRERVWPVPRGGTLRDLAATLDGDIWAVGGNGEVFRLKLAGPTHEDRLKAYLPSLIVSD